MGAYVNSQDGRTKEQWLDDNGSVVTQQDAREFTDFDGPELLVCVVVNSRFSAAAIAFDAGELQTFLRADMRPKFWYRVPVVDLLLASDLADYRKDLG